MNKSFFQSLCNMETIENFQVIKNSVQVTFHEGASLAAIKVEMAKYAICNHEKIEFRIQFDRIIATLNFD